MAKRSFRNFDAARDESLLDDELSRYEHLARRHRPSEFARDDEGFVERRRNPRHPRRKLDDATHRS